MSVQLRIGEGDQVWDCEKNLCASMVGWRGQRSDRAGVTPGPWGWGESCISDYTDQKHSKFNCFKSDRMLLEEPIQKSHSQQR